MFKVGDIIQTLDGAALITRVSTFGRLYDILWADGHTKTITFEKVDMNIKKYHWKKIGETAILQALYDIMNYKYDSTRIDVEIH